MNAPYNAAAIDALVSKLYAGYTGSNKPRRTEDDEAFIKQASTDMDQAAFALLCGALNDLHSIAQSLDRMANSPLYAATPEFVPHDAPLNDD